MACCEKRPYLCGILVLGSLALFFHLVGFGTPGWIIMRWTVKEDVEFEFGGQLIDHGGVTPPHTDDMTTDVIFRRRRSEHDSDGERNEDGEHHGGRNHDQNHQGTGHHSSAQDPNLNSGEHHRQSEMQAADGGMMQEQKNVHAWMMDLTAEINVYTVRICYGLWYSKICVNSKTMEDDDSAEMHQGRESSSNGDHRMGNYRCKKISTQVALHYSSKYDIVASQPGNRRILPLSDKNFGYASLKENQIESCVVLVFLALGLISAVVGFRKVSEGRCAAIACIIFMFLAAFIATVPVTRLSHYSINKAHQGGSVMVHPPYSVIATGVGALFAIITAIVAAFALRTKSRKQSPGTWYKFNNASDGSEKKETSSLGYCADPLPVKAGLYDICNFEDIKPVEEMKKPEEKPIEFVL